MKKLSKKQKLISFISILLITVISAIVITTNIINKINIARKGYSSTNANANSKLVARYIKSGITIGGITGTLEILDTSDATAIPEDIIWGKTAYVKGEKITGTKVVTVAQGKASQKVFEQNTILIDDYGNKVKVPEGFKIAEESSTKVTGGVVIEDVTAKGATKYTKGSQFVWVPIGDVKTDNLGNSTNITLGRYTFDSKGNETLMQLATEWEQEVKIENFTETTISNYGNMVSKNLREFITSTLANNGFFIGRYEAGDAYATDSARSGTNGESNPNNPVTCKAGVYPYNYLWQSDASNLGKNMYNSSNFKSDICNSYVWDTTIVFIQEFSGDEDYSNQIALGNTLTKCGESTDGVNKDVRCNIYDMAGNARSWTTETYLLTERPCVGRGGSYAGNSYWTCQRSSSDIKMCDNASSFRPIIYF